MISTIKNTNTVFNNKHRDYLFITMSESTSIYGNKKLLEELLSMGSEISLTFKDSILGPYLDIDTTVNSELVCSHLFTILDKAQYKYSNKFLRASPKYYTQLYSR
jgi:hypothetical protein